jgi:hypothetical protein
MTTEGYTNEEIDKHQKEGADRNRNLINKGVCRIKHYNDDLYVVPKAFD